MNGATDGYLPATMRPFRKDTAEHRSRGPRQAKLGGLTPALSSWAEAAQWAREQDARRAGEQRRFASDRTLLDLERVWALPTYAAPAGLGLDDLPAAAGLPFPGRHTTRAEADPSRRAEAERFRRS